MSKSELPQASAGARRVGGSGFRRGLAGALCGALSASAAVVYTAPDGSTFDVTDGVLTATVPAAVTNGYDYVSNILDKPELRVAHVVKAGAGMLDAPAAPHYAGTWRVAAGVLAWQAANSFGTALGDAEHPAVVVEAGAAVVPAQKVAALNDRAIRIAGAGTGQDGVKGAIANLLSGHYATFSGMRLTLDADAALWTSSARYHLRKSEIDVNGHALACGGSPWTWSVFEEDTVVTNRSATPGGVRFDAKDFKVIVGDSKWLGGRANRLDATGAGRLYLEGKAEGDWTLHLKGDVRGGRSADPQTESRFGWFAPAVIGGTATIGNRDNADKGYGFVFGGPVSGEASAKMVVERGAWVAFAGAEAAYAGDLELKGGGDATYRCAVCFRTGAPFLTAADKTVMIADSDLWMDAETVRQLPALRITSGISTVAGAAAGSTIAAITLSGGATNVLDTPASVGVYTLTSGTLVVGASGPVIDRLVCEEGVLDLNGQDISVGALAGEPQLRNGGTLTVPALVLDAAKPAFALCGGMRLAEGAACAVTFAGGPVSPGVYEVLHVAPGGALPDLSHITATVPADCTAACATRPVTTGPRTGWTAVVLTVSPRELPAAVSQTETDGTRIDVQGRLLTVTVPAAVTNGFDYAPLVQEHAVTNIVKRGAGALDAPQVADYVGDFTVAEGQLLVNAQADLGRSRFGRVRVLDGAALTVQEGAPDYCICGAAIELAGAGPDGRGAMRSASNREVTITGNVYRLTADAKWLGNVGGKKTSPKASFIDVAGHVLSFCCSEGGSWAQMGYFSNCTVTNSVAGSKGRIRIVTEPGVSYPKFQLDGPSTLSGGPANEVSYERIYIGKTDGDWTLPMTGKTVWGAVPASDTSVSNASYWAGTVRIDADSTFGNNEAIQTSLWVTASRPYPFAVRGPIHGGAGKTLTLDTAFHLFSRENDFAGKVVVTSASINQALKNKRLSDYFRNGLWLHDGAVFSCGAGIPVEFDDADLWFADGTPLAMPALKHVAGDCWITGGAPGGGEVPRPVIAAIEKVGDGVLVLATSAAVTGRLSVARGTLALGTNGLGAACAAAELPVLSNLVFAAETTFNMNNSALTIPNLAGVPAVTNAGALTIGASMLVESAENVLATASSVAFAPGAVIKVPAAFSPVAGRAVEICAAEGGVLGDVPAVDDPRRRPWHVEKSADGKALLLTRVEGGTMLILR